MKLFYSKPVRFIVIICVFLLGVVNLSDMFVDISRPVFYGGLCCTRPLPSLLPALITTRTRKRPARSVTFIQPPYGGY